jgi:hypothetical protein
VKIVLAYVVLQLDSLAPHFAVLLGAPQLAAAGFNLQPVQEQLVALQQVARDTYTRLPNHTDAAEPADVAQGLVVDFVQQLRVFRDAASSIPVPDFCNNPDCATARGQSEAELVLGRSCMCGGCCVAHYCGRACQRLHWACHKPACKALAAARGAGGAGGGGEA